MRAASPTALAFLLLACSSTPRDPAPPSAPPPPSAPAAAELPPASPCARRGAGPAPAPLDPTHAGSGVALAGLGGRTLAFVADEDDGAIHTVDLDARAAIARTPLAGRPAQVIVLGDGRVVASLRDRGLLEVLEPGDAAAPLARRCLVPVASEPVGLAMTPDRATLLVASRWGHALTSLATADLRRLGELPLARDPSAVVASADGARAFVSHAVGGRVSVVTLGEGGAPTGARELSTDGAEWRFQTMLSKKSSLQAPRPSAPAPSASARSPGFDPLDDLLSMARPRSARVERRGSQGFALARAANGAVFAPIALVDPGPATGGGGYGSARVQTVIEHIAVVDAHGAQADVPPVSSHLGTQGCHLPRAAAIEPGEEVLLVACLGLDEVIAYDARAQIPGQPPRVGSVRDRELFRARVGAGPTAIAVDSARRRAVVFSRFDGALTLLPAARDPGPTRIRAPSKELAGELPVVVLPRASRLDAQRAEGQRLFHAAGGRRIAFDGRACASCHPDGRDDALTWSTPEGPRQTPMLMGRLDGTAPYGWEGDKKDLEGHFARTMSRLGGTGLRADERDAIFAYLHGMERPGEAAVLTAEERAVTVGPLPPAVQAGAATAGAATAGAREAAARADLAARGDALFHSTRAGCSSCHLGDELTTDGARHDVRSATRFEAVRAFDTPSLRFVGRSAPYYHDGRYATLLALVEGVDGTMGHTAHLSAEDRRALIAYLESL
ncbi:cytochrome C peroxidase [Sorangium sp. So ce1667]